MTFSTVVEKSIEIPLYSEIEFVNLNLVTSQKSWEVDRTQENLEVKLKVSLYGKHKIATELDLMKARM